MNYANSYLIFNSDFRKRNWKDWLLAHVMLAPPPHRFKGELSLTPYNLNFRGLDTYEGAEVEFAIRKADITQLYMGYDETFSTFQTRGVGLTWSPIRITIEPSDTDSEKYLYAVVGFNGIASANQQVFEYLKEWLS